jgi:hypothetical protein
MPIDRAQLSRGPNSSSPMFRVCRGSYTEPGTRRSERIETVSSSSPLLRTCDRYRRSLGWCSLVSPLDWQRPVLAVSPTRPCSTNPGGDPPELARDPSVDLRSPGRRCPLQISVGPQWPKRRRDYRFLGWLGQTSLLVRRARCRPLALSAGAAIALIKDSWPPFDPSALGVQATLAQPVAGTKLD